MNLARCNAVAEFITSVEVMDTDLTKVRIGGTTGDGSGDGGYVVCDETCRVVKRLYSLGVRGDARFERAFLETYQNAGVRVYDPTVGQVSVTDDRFQLFKENAKHGAWLTNNEPGFDLMLKIDADYAEWEVLEQFSVGQLRRFKQMVLKLHLVHVGLRSGMEQYFREMYRRVLDDVNENLFARYAAVINKLREVFYIVHIHADNNMPKEDIGYYHLPPILELTLVRKDMVCWAKETHSSFPTVLDRPCRNDRAEVTNYYPLGMGG